MDLFNKQLKKEEKDKKKLKKLTHINEDKKK